MLSRFDPDAGHGDVPNRCTEWPRLWWAAAVAWQLVFEGLAECYDQGLLSVANRGGRPAFRVKVPSSGVNGGSYPRLPLTMRPPVGLVEKMKKLEPDFRRVEEGVKAERYAVAKRGYKRGRKLDATVG